VRQTEVALAGEGIESPLQDMVRAGKRWSWSINVLLMESDLLKLNCRPRWGL